MTNFRHTRLACTRTLTLLAIITLPSDEMLPLPWLGKADDILKDRIAEVSPHGRLADVTPKTRNLLLIAGGFVIGCVATMMVCI